MIIHLKHLLPDAL